MPTWENITKKIGMADILKRESYYLLLTNYAYGLS